MARWSSLVVAVLALTAAPVHAGDISGTYLEARTCDVYTGACFANADTGLIGKHAVIAWKVDKGSLGDVRLDGLGIVAVVVASDTLGLKQTGEAKSLLIVDEKASPAQRAALITLAKRQGGELIKNVLKVEAAPVALTICECKEGGCAKLNAGDARIETRCLDTRHDRGCGADTTFYPPLAKNVKARAAMATEHVFTGKLFNENWKDSDRRGAFLGTFEVR